MSLCICLQNNDELIIAADTALIKKHNEEYFRFRKPFRKLEQIDNFLIFMSGSADVAQIVIEQFRKKSIRSIYSLRRIVIDSCNDFASTHPEIVETQDAFTRGVALLAAEYSETGVKVHSIQPGDNFELHTHVASPTNTITHTAGIYDDKAEALLNLYLSRGDRSAVEVIDQVFHELSGEHVGGSLIMARVNKNGITFMPDRQIIERVRLRYYEDVHFNLNGASLIGSSILTAVSGQRITMDTSGFRSVDSGNKSRVVISPNTPTYGVAGIQFNDENEVHKGQIFSNTGGMGIVAHHDMNILSQTGITRIGGHVSFSGAQFVDFSNTAVNMPQKADAFSGLYATVVTKDNNGNTIQLLFQNGLLQYVI